MVHSFRSRGKTAVLVLVVQRSVELDLSDEIGFFDVAKSDLDGLSCDGLLALCFLLDSGEVKGEVDAVEAREAAGEVAIGFDRAEGLNFDEAAAETVVVGGLEELAFEARGRGFKGVLGTRNEIFDVEHGAEIPGKVGAVFVGNAGEELDWNALGEVCCGILFCCCGGDFG